MKEVWKNIKGYEGYYEVSNWGRVRNVARMNKVCMGIHKKTGKIMKQFLHHLGYKCIGLRGGRKKRRYLVHRLVGEAFLKKRLQGEEINHKNGKKADNHIENLEWTTRRENIKHAFRLGLQIPCRGELSGRSKLTEKQVRNIRKMYSKGKTSYRKLSKAFGVGYSTIAHIIKRESWKHI